jgi:hypothetical protein
MEWYGLKENGIPMKKDNKNNLVNLIFAVSAFIMSISISIFVLSWTLTRCYWY